MVSAQYNQAEYIPTTHFWSGRNGQRAAWIIVHGTAGGSSAQEVAQWFTTNSPPTSTHYVIGQDGSVVQCVQEEDSAWGNGVLSEGHANWWNENVNPNLQTISIEHVKPDAANNTMLTAQQQASSFALISYLCTKWNIPPRAADATGGITGHFSIDPVNRADCPGTFPWTALWSYLGSPAGVGPLNYVVNAVTQASKAPLSPGFLGIVEQVDQWQQLPVYPRGNVAEWGANPGPMVQWGLGFAEAVGVRLLIMMVGALIIILVLFNTMRQIVEAEAQVAAPVIGAAASGAL